jgi:FkbM family methyltransferase
MHGSSSRFFQRTKEAIQLDGLASLPGKAFRLTRKLWKQATFKPYVHQLKGEHRFQMHIADIWSEEWYAENPVAPFSASWMKQNLREGDLVVDCGAHNGIISLIASGFVGNTGKVIAIEALPHNAKVIAKNLELNNIRNVELLNVIGSSEPGELYVEHQSFGLLFNSNGIVRDTPVKGATPVACTTLDAILNGRTARYIKIDVEGHEIEVLKGAREALRSAPCLDIEVHTMMWDDPAKKVQELFDLIEIGRYEGMIEIEHAGPAVQFDHSRHTPGMIAGTTKANLYLRPRS